MAQPDPVRTYLSVQKRYEGATMAFLKRPTPRAHQDYLKLSFARNMSILKMLKGNKRAEGKRKAVILDNHQVLTTLRVIQASHPEIHSNPGKQQSFLKELI
jgi:hypothetical protein